MKLNYKFLYILLITFCFNTNAAEIQYRDMLALNAKSIAKISHGMTEVQVKKIMGSDTTTVRDGPLNNPWKTEIIADTIILHYLVKNHPPFTPILEYQAQPIIISNDKVSAIGRGFLKAARKKAIIQNEETISGENSIESRLSTLNKLYKSGIITGEEYKKQKQRILNSI